MKRVMVNVLASCALCIALVPNASAQSQPPPPAITAPHWQLGLEWTPLAYRWDRVAGRRRPPPVEPSVGFGAVEGFEEPLQRTELEGAQALPAELGMLAARDLGAWLSIGLRVSIASHQHGRWAHQRLALQAGPFLRVYALRGADYRLTCELGGNLLVGRDRYELVSQAIPVDPTMPADDITRRGTLGGSLRVQFGGQWFLSETISIDPSVRVEHARYGGDAGYRVESTRVLLTIGMSIWLGQDPVQSPVRRPAGDVRDQFEPLAPP